MEDDVFQILIVDDTRSVHAFVKSLLTKAEGIEVSSVMNGEEGVRELQSEKTYDVVLLDWEMPVLNGPAAFEKIKLLGVKTPVIMMTTKNDPSDIQQMLTVGISEYLIKPFTADILFEKIEFVTGKSFKYVT